jgi:hypothetical protein
MQNLIEMQLAGKEQFVAAVLAIDVLILDS